MTQRNIPQRDILAKAISAQAILADVGVLHRRLRRWCLPFSQNTRVVAALARGSCHVVAAMS